MNNLKALRRSLRMTQKSLAEEIGQTISSIGHYESGRRQPDIKTCHQLVVALSKNGERVSIEDIFPDPNATGNSLSVTSCGQG
ncbi:helix-turn-helix transcriptional regulator [Buttiauxella noackiae]|uniref:helix-turn-helix transcriptional regulator n=1 Tax=Buttiauxella noackiae TaxID=82992 RepID=UPI0028D6C3D1|nr:helix-turn-helix transcriptional regulator [Buttiauxella noackiae]